MCLIVCMDRAAQEGSSSSSRTLPSIRDVLPEFFQSRPQEISLETIADEPDEPEDTNNNAGPSTEPAQASSRKRYICETCQKAFRRPSNLNAHMVTHTREKPYACTHPDCDKRFTTRSNMLRHVRTVHRGEVPAAVPAALGAPTDEGSVGSRTESATPAPASVDVSMADEAGSAIESGQPTASTSDIRE